MRTISKILTLFSVFAQFTHAENAVADEPPVLLPPYEVEGERGPPWRYAVENEVEILYRCPDDIAVSAVDRYFRLIRMMNILLPQDSELNTKRIRSLVLEDKEYEPKVSRELTNAITTQIIDKQKSGTDKLQFMPNFHFWDEGSESIYFVLDTYQQGFSLEGITVSPNYLRYNLETQAPLLPRWFIEGICILQQTVIMPVPPVGRVVGWDSSHNTLFKSKQAYDRLRFLPFEWGSKAGSAEVDRLVRLAVRTGGQAMMPEEFTLLPMKRLLSETGAPAEDQSLFQLQAALFLRWIFDPNPLTPAANNILGVGPKPGPDALWRYMEQSENNRGSETVFKDCFGWGFDEIDTILRSYLPYACLKSSKFVLESTDSGEMVSELRSHIASDLEIARLKGRLSRLSIRYVREFIPELTQPYISQARRTLGKPSEVDANLLAEQGLCEVDAGNDAGAFPLLLKTIENNVNSARSYYELARIQFTRLREVDPKLSVSGTEADEIAAHLIRGLTHSPALPQSYALLFEIWLRRNHSLTTEQLGIAANGAELFPAQFRVVYAAMLLQISNGHAATAKRIGALAQTWIVDEDEREKVMQLAASIKDTTK